MKWQVGGEVYALGCLRSVSWRVSELLTEEVVGLKCGRNSSRVRRLGELKLEAWFSAW